MGHTMKVSMKWIKKKAKGSMFGKMEVPIQGDGNKVKLMAMENTVGVMGGYMKVIGSIIICKDMENISGLMVEYMKESINKIKRMVLEYIIGRMVRNMKEHGKMDYKKVKVN